MPDGVKFVLSSAGLAAFCWCADYAIFTWEAKWKRLLHGGVLRAVADNAVHGVVGGWCWANAVLLMREPFGCVRMLQVAACVATASAVDLDHFIEARSLSFQDALNLQQRPFAHNTTLILLGTAALYLLIYFFPSVGTNPFTRDLPMMFLLATLSHHLRDADRRGIWLGPFFSTPPIPHRIYPFLIIVLVSAPTLVHMLLKALVKMPKTIGLQSAERTSTVLQV